MNTIVYRLREHLRTPVEIEGECLIVAGPSAGEAMSAVTIINISIGGCQVRARPGYLTDGCEVAIRFGDIATLRGMVCWSTEAGVGVRFVERLAPSLLQRLIDGGRGKRHLRSVA